MVRKDASELMQTGFRRRVRESLEPECVRFEGSAYARWHSDAVYATDHDDPCAYTLLRSFRVRSLEHGHELLREGEGAGQIERQNLVPCCIGKVLE